MDNYFITKPNYVCNPESTFDCADNSYWTEERITLSIGYQYEVYKEAKKLFSINNANRFLDLGCGPPAKLSHFFKNCSGYFCLADQPSVSPLAKKIFPNADFVPVDLNLKNEKLNDGNFDIILCADVIEHLSRPDNLLETIRANLSPSGLVILSTPDRDIRSGEENLCPNNPQHVREWNKKELHKFLNSKGFKVEKQNNVPISRQRLLSNFAFRYFRLFRKHPIKAGGQRVIATLKNHQPIQFNK